MGIKNFINIILKDFFEFLNCYKIDNIDNCNEDIYDDNFFNKSLIYKKYI